MAQTKDGQDIILLGGKFLKLWFTYNLIY